MLPDVRLKGWGYFLPETSVSNAELAERIGTTDDLGESTGIAQRHFSAPGHGPSGLAQKASMVALDRAAIGVDDLALLVFATTTPDVAFPGSACFLQEKLSAPTVGALDIRAQSAGFVAALDMAAGFSGVHQTDDGGAPILVAAAEVFSSCLDFSPAGQEMASRLGDGAAVAVLAAGGAGPQLLSSRWYTDGTHLEKFWTDAPHGWQMGGRLLPADLAEGRHYPQADLPALRDLARQRLLEVLREVGAETQTAIPSAARVVVDYVEPQMAREVAAELGLAAEQLVVPTAEFGHVMAAGTGIALARTLEEARAGDRIVLASAGPGFTWGAAVIEVD